MVVVEELGGGGAVPELDLQAQTLVVSRAYIVRI